MKEKEVIFCLKKLVDERLPGIIDTMNFAETKLQKIKRWLRIVKEKPWYIFKRGREQNVLQHSYSLGLLGENILIMIEDKLEKPLDSRILQLCFKVHDWGEPLLERDVCALDKKDSDDADEYEAFSKKIKDLPEKIQEKYKEAFLLQFCFNSNTSCFSVEAMAIMERLWVEKRNEAIFFKAIENLEYLLFSIEQAIEKEDFDYYITVCRNQFEKLDSFASLFPVLNLIWNEEFKKSLKNISFSMTANNRRLDAIR